MRSDIRNHGHDTGKQRAAGDDRLCFPLSAESPEEYILKMLQRGAVPGLLPLTVRSVDGERQICYERSGQRSLSEAAESLRMDRAGLLRLADALAEILRQLTDHLLPREGLLPDPDHVFVDDQGRYSFCYDPGGKGNIREGITALAEFLLPRLDRTDREGVLLGYSFCLDALETGGSPDVFRHIRSGPVQLFPSAAPGPAFPGSPDAGAAAGGAGEWPAGEREQDGWEENDPGADPGLLLPAPGMSRDEILDAFFEPEEERRPLRLKLWQQRILVASGAAAAGSCILGAIRGEMFIGGGCSLIAAALGCYFWIRFSRKERSSGPEAF